jgi:hypothetical protein
MFDQRLAKREPLRLVNPLETSCLLPTYESLERKEMSSYVQDPYKFSLLERVTKNMVA